MSLGNLGIGALREALDTTNELLASVLEELRRTNGAALKEIAEEVRAQRAALERMSQQSTPA